jgi:nucleoside-diphosphate-sugar epimerase
MTLVGKKICVLANKCIVTGVAGFIGSNLTERLLVEGYEVVGVDCFSDYYPCPMKERNLAILRLLAISFRRISRRCHVLKMGWYSMSEVVRRLQLTTALSC